MNPEEATEFALIVGFTASSSRSTDVLLSDLVELRDSFPELEAVLVCENLQSLSEKSKAGLAELRRRGAKATSIPRRDLLRAALQGEFGSYYADPQFQEGIAFSRTVLHHYLYREALGFGSPVIWILDDDMRIDSGPLLNLEGLRLLIKDLRAQRVDIAIGRVSGDAPIPGVTMIRTQLLDINMNLRAMTDADSVWSPEAMKRRNDENTRRFPDFYYDLSLLHSGHLETPWWFACEGEISKRGALEELLKTTKFVRTGVNISRRPSDRCSADFAESEATPTRGGNTLVMNAECLRDYPNISPSVDGLTLRRGDTLWTVLNKRIGRGGRNRKVVSAEFTVRQDRRLSTRSIFESDGLLPDIMGSAFTRAVDEVLGSTTQTKTDVSFTQSELDEIFRRFDALLSERIAMLELNTWRIQGLAKSIRNQIDEVFARGGPDAVVFRRNGDSLMSLLEDCQRYYSPDLLKRVKAAASSDPARHLRNFLQNLPALCDSYYRRLPDSSVSREEAEAFLRVYGPATGLVYLSEGKEGIVFTDGTMAYKVFREGMRSFKPGQVDFLRMTLTPTEGKRTTRIAPLENVISDGTNVAFVTKLVKGTTYEGGSLTDFFSLLRECKKLGICITNLSPENLVSSGDGLAYIDLGRSIERFDERLHREMCKRAFLVYRWHFRSDIKQLLHLSLRDESLPELFGFASFLESLREADTNEISDEEILGVVLGVGRKRLLDYGCGNGSLSDRIAAKGLPVTAYDVNLTRFMARKHHKDVGPVNRAELQGLIETKSRFETELCSRVVCQLPDAEVRNVLLDLRGLIRDDGNLVLAFCNPFNHDNVETQTHMKYMANPHTYRTSFAYDKYIKSTSRWRREYHRPVSWYIRELLRAGFEVTDIIETPGVDIQRLSPGSELLVLCAKPILLKTLPGVSLLIKASAMEWRTIRAQVMHIISQLEGPRAFTERIVVTDRYEGPFNRPYDDGDFQKLMDELTRLQLDNVIDKVVVAPGDAESHHRLNKRWFNLDSSVSRAKNGQATLTTLHGFEQCKGDYILHVDSDCMIGRKDRSHDYLAEMLGIFDRDPRTITVALPVAEADWAEPTSERNCMKWHVEAGCGMVSIPRLREILPLPNKVFNGGLELPWHRAVDKRMKGSVHHSYRGGSSGIFHLHITNSQKRNVNSWYNIMKAIESGYVYSGQLGRVELIGGVQDWLPRRSEGTVIIVRGRNTPISKLRRCFRSLANQSDQDWGIVAIDAGSDNGMEEYLEFILSSNYDGRFTLYRNLEPVPPTANIDLVVRRLCDNRQSAIVMVDADDALLRSDAIEYVKAKYRDGADFVVGGSLRTDKEVRYPPSFNQFRQNRGGSVRQPIRTFRKCLLDQVDQSDLKVDGQWVPHTEDWACMLPLAVLSVAPVYIEQTIYFYEPSDLKRIIPRSDQEETVGKIVSKPSRRERKA